MKYFAIVLFLISTLCALANDGAYYASGSQIFPVKETTVSLKKEILNFKKTSDDYISVTVHFEFYNPGTDKEVLVGFESPGAAGDVGYEDSTYIRNFTIVHDGTPIEFRHTTDPPINRKSREEDEYMPYKHVFLFKITFKKGMNIIDHKYEYKGSISVMFDKGYDYILKTGKRWANSAIEDFELNIDLGENATFILPYSFNKGKPAQWAIDGVGKSKLYTMDMFTDEPQKQLMFCIKTGYVSLRASNFKPDEDLSITTFKSSEDCYLKYALSGIFIKDDFINNLMYLYKNVYEYDTLRLEDFSDTDLRRMKNYFYAKKGFYFKDESLRKFFETYEWYFPDPEIKFEEIVLNDDELKAVAILRSAEKARKGVEEE